MPSKRMRLDCVAGALARLGQVGAGRAHGQHAAAGTEHFPIFHFCRGVKDLGAGRERPVEPD